MKKENVEYLMNQIEFAGFGQELNEKLVEQILKGKKEFSMEFSKEIGKDKVSATLNFAQSDKDTGFYFFNSYDLHLQKEGSKDTISNNFRVQFGNTFTLKEAYNMLDGRFVHKTFITPDKEHRDNRELNKTKNAWSYVDFKNADERGNFLVRRVNVYNLEDHLSKLPIKGIEYANTRQNIIDGLHKGNLTMAIMEINGKEEKMFLKAMPRVNSLEVYDEKMERQRIMPKVAQSQKQEQSEKQEEKQGQQKAPAKKQAAKTEMVAEKKPRKYGKKMR